MDIIELAPEAVAFDLTRPNLPSMIEIYEVAPCKASSHNPPPPTGCAKYANFAQVKKAAAAAAAENVTLAEAGNAGKSTTCAGFVHIFFFFFPMRFPVSESGVERQS